jgi:hypothetical protein
MATATSQHLKDGGRPSGEAGLEPVSAWLAETLVGLIEQHDVSVRLRNSIMLAASSGALPFRTVGDYLEAGEAAPAIMMRQVLNLGRKTARELHALIQAGHTASPGESSEPAGPCRRSVLRAELLAFFEGDSVSAALQDEMLSARLASALTREPLASMDFAALIEALPQTVAAMLRQPNCGRKSTNELRAKLVVHVRRRLHEAGYDNVDTLADMLLSQRSSPAASLNVSNAPTEVPDETTYLATPDPFATPDHVDLAERLEWLLAEIPPRAQEILRRRNGIGQAERETLEELGAVFDVTRERIRQIESKSLKRLRVRIRRAPLWELLDAGAPAQWRTLAGDAPSLRRAALQDRRQLIDPYIRLAFAIEEATLEQWLDRTAQPLEHGWLRAGEDIARVEAAADRLTAALEGAALPQPLAALVAPEEVPAARLAAELILSLPERHLYIMPARVGARLTRLVRLHALLASERRMWPMEQLLAHYRARFADDPCSERDATIVMEAAPHLFLELEDGCWSAIGVGGGLFDDLPQEPPSIPPRAEEPGTISHALQEALAIRGPTRLVDLVDDADAVLPDGRSANSIGPMLLMRRELFVRALPGVYALPDQVAAVRTAMPNDWPVFFNDGQARFYALARYAGEPREIFPLWTPRAEHLLCRWARHSGGPGILSSLLAVAAIDDWLIAEAERQDWRDLKVAEGRYALGVALRHAAAYERPPLDRLFAACRYAVANGSFNWVAGNRLTNRKIDAHGGAGLVALMIKLGALEECRQDGYRWQRPHRVAPGAAALADELEDVFGRSGAVDWTSPVGRQLAARAADTNLPDDSWVDAVAVVEMLGRTPSAAISEFDDDPLAQLYAEQRRAREAERREATLQWLLEQ